MKPFLILTAISLALFHISCSPSQVPPKTVTKLNKSSYAGQWHEIARLPNFFERDLIAAKATYIRTIEGNLSVLNQGLKADGETTSITGTATPAPSGNPGELKVRFDRFPASLFAGDYWILEANDSYTRALVGSPDYKYLWLLSKNPADTKDDFAAQIARAKQQGFETEKLIFNPKRISN
ncbi:MAG: lipocalin family protein [Luteolibacter sp.]